MSERLESTEKKMEEYFAEIGMTEYFKLFSEDAECRESIDDAFNRLMVVYEELKENAPALVLDMIKNQVYCSEEGKEVFGSDLIQSAKLNLYVILQMDDGCKERKTVEKLLEDLKNGSYEAMLDFMECITCEMLVQIHDHFVTSAFEALIAREVTNGRASVIAGVFNPKSGKIELHSLNEFFMNDDSDKEGSKHSQQS